MISGLILTVVLLVANGLFVALEFALIASRRTKLEPIAQEGSKRAKLALRAVGSLNFELAAAQLGVTVASLGLGYIAEPTFSHLLSSTIGQLVTLPPAILHTGSFVVALLIVSLLHMVIGEMVPKNLVLADPERSLLTLAVPNRVYTWLFGPVVHLFNAMAEIGIRALGVNPRDEIETIHSAEDLGYLVAASRAEGFLDDFEHDLLSGALGMAHRPVSEIMVPWSQVKTMPTTSTRRELERAWTTSGYSRLPIVTADDRPLGFLHAKDLLGASDETIDQRVPLGRVRRMVLLDKDQTLEDVLLAMQWSRLHLGIVQTPTGEALGLVTLEDILEELVGDIRDETDRS